MAKESALLNAFKNDTCDSIAVDASKKVKIGIIGTGWIAEAHVASYLKMPDVEIVAAADIVPGKAKAFCERLGLKDTVCYESHTELLDKAGVDAVSVCTYNRAHAVPTIDALNRGIHVLLEKPMCCTIEEAAEIMKAEKKSGKVLSIGFQPRFDSNMKLIKRIVESGELGKVYYIQTGGGRRRGIPTMFGTSFIAAETGGIGAMGDLGCYSLDMVLNAVGYPKPLTVSGYTSDFIGKEPSTYTARNNNHPEYAEAFGVEDFAAGFIRLEGDIILDFRISWAMHMSTAGDTLILGTKGGLRIPSTECWNGSTGGPMTIYKTVAGELVETVVPVINDIENFDELFDKKIRSFLDALKNGLPAPVPSSQIIYNQAIIDGIIKSNKIGKEIEIKIPDLD